MSRLRPDAGPSVFRHQRPVEKATIDLTDRRPVPGKVETAGAIDEDARFADDVARIERGDFLQEMPDIKTQMAHVARKAQATEAVIEKLEEEFRVEFMKLAAAHCASSSPLMMSRRGSSSSCSVKRSRCMPIFGRRVRT